MGKVDKMKGLNVGSTYLNAKQYANYVTYIDNVERKIEEELQRAKVISVLTYASVDVSTIENEAICARYCVDGKVNVVFIGMEAVQRATAGGIYGALNKVLTLDDRSGEVECFLTKVIGLGSDSASVNTGKKGGQIALLHQEISEAIVIIRCMAHTLELAFTNSMKGCSLYEKLDSKLYHLYAFYHRSALQKSNQDQVQLLSVRSSNFSYLLDLWST